ncbi:MAG TPA: IS1595 family transposase, partial [Pyrinomonadaceae bacterium]|nr:IS1595 family transposase [Pyrinomonadaceae bacterium]
MKKEATPKTLQQAIVFFSDPENCLNYMASRRWPNGPVCPTCGRTDVTFLAKQQKWQCKSAHKRRQFTVKVGTIFEDSPLGLDKWLTAVWMVTNCKNGVSSYEISRALGVTQKTAWFMLHRIRVAMQTGSFEKKMGGEGYAVEADVPHEAGATAVQQRRVDEH